MSEAKEGEMSDVAVKPRRLVPVHQIDREAYAHTAIVREDDLRKIREGDWDCYEGVQAFARHRILVEQVTADECAQLARSTSTLDDGFPYDRGRLHAYLAIREMFPAKDHSQWCVCAYCLNLRGKYSEEC